MKPSWDATLYDARHAFVWKHGAALLDLLQPHVGECIIDLGCGTGHLTAQIAAAGAEVIGLDLSPSMIEQARRNHPTLRFAVADAQDFTLEGRYDAVFSNAALHWVRAPELAIACIRRALKPGGRFVAEFGGKGNVVNLRAALSAGLSAIGDKPYVHPWYFPAMGEYIALLEANGLEAAYALLFDRPTPLEGEGGLRDWVRMFAAETLDAIPPERHVEFFEAVEAAARPQVYRDGVWMADYRRLRVMAQAI